MWEMLGKCISILYRQEQKNNNAAMKHYDLKYSCYNFLIYLSQNEGVSQKEMCSPLSLDETLATRTMQKLQKQGFIARKKENMRSYSVYLTKRLGKLSERKVKKDGIEQSKSFGKRKNKSFACKVCSTQYHCNACKRPL